MNWQTTKEVKALIKAANGPTELGRRMGFSRQRVSNWCVAGRIPEMVVKAYAPLFKRIMARAAVVSEGQRKLAVFANAKRKA
jgi:hypothetical protein